MEKAEIETAARKAIREILLHQDRIWPAGVPSPLEMLDPEAGALALGVRYERHDSLGRFGYRGAQFEVAGLLDRQAGKIAVSNRFPEATIRFTGAHELGHLMLHPGELHHRDRPVKGLPEGVGRPKEEMEADYFAACFLVPRKLLKQAYEVRFRTSKAFEFTEANSFHLAPDDYDSLLSPAPGSLDRSIAIATAQSFAGYRFDSLATLFRVSPTSMAIRLKEVGLVTND
jgi:hypothetical protein